MFFYNWREMAAWIAIFVVALAMIVVGLQSSNGGVVRIATGPKGSVSQQAGDALKLLLERRTPWKIALVPANGSLHAQRLLLEGKADLAFVAPAALGASQNWVGVAPIASLYSFLLVEPKADETALHSLNPSTIDLASGGADSAALGWSILETLGLVGHDQLRLDEQAPAKDAKARLITDFYTAPEWPALVQSERYRLAPLSEAAALSIHAPLWVSATIPAGAFSFGAHQMPPSAIVTVATPLILASLPDLAPSIAAEVAAVLHGHEGVALTARFQAQNSESAWQLIAKHAAIGGEDLPVRDLLRQEIAWWLQHKVLILLIIVAIVLVVVQVRNLRATRIALAERRAIEAVESMLNQILQIEQQARTENDLRQLRQWLDEVLQFKLQGSRQMLGNDLAHDPLLGTFHQQCNYTIALLDQRLKGKQNLVAVA
ncbi:Hypothetical protein HDN1F_12240 [gamma proteobacterium HdN1]|nr:Hypothetical protein HDN1F_12240 [gamma proteobacterium HdN1]